MIQVACAIIEHAGKVLVTQRGPQQAEAGLWEFPGGKLEPGESPESCIVREIAEELDITVVPLAQLEPATHRYPAKTIRLIPLVCRWQGGELQLHEHADCRWLLPHELSALPWCPADLPIVAQYLQRKGFERPPRGFEF